MGVLVFPEKRVKKAGGGGVQGLREFTEMEGKRGGSGGRSTFNKKERREGSVEKGRG